MADHTAGTAATTVLRHNEYVLSAQCSLNLLRPAAGQLLRCRSTVIKSGRRLVITESELFAVNDGKSTLVSKATVTLVVLKLREAAE
jgi:acyl-coenzyme A thioesterase PaaI-like protein